MPTAERSISPPKVSSPKCWKPAVEPLPVWTPPVGTRETCGVAEAVTPAAMMLVVILVRQVTTLPPGFPVPLH